MSVSELFDRRRVIDVDTHLTEPPGVFVDRIPHRWADAVPQIKRIDGVDCWVSGERVIGRPGRISAAGFAGTLPDGRNTMEEIPAAMYEASARLEMMGEEGIQAEVIFPNVGGLGGATYFTLGEPEFVKGLVRAYNDFITEWTAADPDRLLAITTTPFWDLEFAISEISRCKAMGHRAINFCNAPEHHGLPPLASAHWDPLWSVVQEIGVPVCLHQGGGNLKGLEGDPAAIGVRANFAKESALMFSDNQRAIADVIFGGICHRFPRLRFVSVESGVGWIPGVLEALDWQWSNTGVVADHPEYDLLPSEYFRRQIYGCFWFERTSAVATISQFPNNCLFETDYPHPTCQYPSPGKPSQRPRDYASEALADLPEELLANVLHDTAAELFGLSEAGEQRRPSA